MQEIGWGGLGVLTALLALSASYRRGYRAGYRSGERSDFRRMFPEVVRLKKQVDLLRGELERKV